MIRATTPTSEGFAQAFDSSGLVQLAEHQRQKKDKALQQLLIDYDTKGINPRDIEFIQGKMSEINQWAMQNHKALVNPSKNMETYMEFERKKSELKNHITGSIASKEYAKTATNRYYNGAGGLFMTPKNQDIIYNYSQKPTADQYNDFSAYADPTQGFDRNYKIDPESYVKAVKFKATPTEDTGERIGGKIVTKEAYEVDEEATKNHLQMIWNKMDLEGYSLKDMYKNDFNAFYADAVKMAENPTEFGLTAPVKDKEAKEKTAADMKAEAAVLFRKGSGFSMIETMYDPESQKPFRTDIRDENGKRKDAVNTYGIMTAGGGESTMTFYPDLRIKKNVDQAYDMTTGQMLASGEGKRYEWQVPVERGNYMTANQTFEITYTNEEGKKVTNKFSKGETVPDLEAMKKDGSLSSDEYNKAAGKVSATDGYIVYASNEKLDYFDLAPGEDIMNMMEGKGGRFLMVPAWSINHEVDQQLKYKHGKTQAQYLEEKKLEVKKSGYDFFTGQAFN